MCERVYVCECVCVVCVWCVCVCECACGLCGVCVSEFMSECVYL